MEQTENDNRISFLLKSMKEEYVESFMKGRLCFQLPAVFNKWEDKKAAQFDRHDSHSAYAICDMKYAIIIDEKDGVPRYGEVKTFADKGIIRLQSERVKHTPICCFRIIEPYEYKIIGNELELSLGDTAERIATEFKHDAYVLIQAAPFINRIRQQFKCFCGAVQYKDTLNNYEFLVPDVYKETVEQLFRKDQRFEWQKEYRIALEEVSETSPTFIDIGSIEDIAIYGKITDLKD